MVEAELRELKENEVLTKMEYTVVSGGIERVCIMGTKQNPFTYEHDYLVQKVLDEIVGGIRFHGKNID